jgi:hypothetical protein
MHGLGLACSKRLTRGKLAARLEVHCTGNGQPHSCLSPFAVVSLVRHNNELTRTPPIDVLRSRRHTRVFEAERPDMRERQGKRETRG